MSNVINVFYVLMCFKKKKNWIYRKYVICRSLQNEMNIGFIDNKYVIYTIICNK